MRIVKPISNGVAETLQWIQPETMLAQMALRVCSSRRFLFYIFSFSPYLRYLYIAYWGENKTIQNQDGEERRHGHSQCQEEAGT